MTHSIPAIVSRIAILQKPRKLSSMKKSSYLNVILLICMLLGIVGCETATVKDGAQDAVGWARSEMKVALENNLTDVNNAIEVVCNDLKLFQINKERDLLSGKYIYRNAKDEKITLVTEAKTTEITELRIQVGLMGDTAQSRLILDKIREKLN